MEGLHILKYAVRGIKNIDQWAELSFYKKTIDRRFDIHGYNVKGIYGANGSGKSALITSVEILKLLIVDSSYLSNPIAQRELDALINKKLGKLEICTDFIFSVKNGMRQYHYEIAIEKDESGKFSIQEECLTEKNVKSHSDSFTVVYQVEKGELNLIIGSEEGKKLLLDRTKNLLSRASLSSLYFEKHLNNPKDNPDRTYTQLVVLYMFGYSLFTFMDSEDDHTAYYIRDFITSDSLDETYDMDVIMGLSSMIKDKPLVVLSPKKNNIVKDDYPVFEKEVEKLNAFLRIFKNDLKGISIDRKETQEGYVCDLIMNYADYSVNSEFESTGIKKLIALFVYLENMVNGNIVFIDEMDSNLHDVYLCALLEYLMEDGKGQLCFTTHNIGPMDILRKNKKSIDFLSADHRIISWKTNGNYSPAKLYKEGMIEGSPFNVFPFDFLEAFAPNED